MIDTFIVQVKQRVILDSIKKRVNLAKFYGRNYDLNRLLKSVLHLDLMVVNGDDLEQKFQAYINSEGLSTTQ